MNNDLTGQELTVTDSHLGRIEATTSLTVKRHHINQFTDRETITVVAEPLPPHRAGRFQLMRIGGNVWKEISVGAEGDAVVLSEKQP